MAYAVAPPLPAFTPAGYPVQWRNVGDDAVITINLPEVRPHSPQELDGDDVVLLVRAGAVDAVEVTWTASAEVNGVYVECEGQFEVAVEEIEARRAALDALEASSK
jgi:hypothetical protein